MTPASGTKPQVSPLQLARVMWLMFLAAACLIIAVTYILSHPHGQLAPQPSLNWDFAAIGAADIVVLAIFRRSVLGRSRAQSDRGEEAQARESWISAQVLGFASAMSIVLFGFVLHVMGARPPVFSTAFFAAGLVMMVAYWPQRPESR